MQEATSVPSLMLDVRSRVCALPLAHVVETMRPLPVAALQGVPAPVLGVARIRGMPVPVLDPGRLLSDASARAARFVTVRVGTRQVALSVEGVLGVHRMAAAAMHDCPPLLRDADQQLVVAVASADRELLFVLDAARIVPESVWQAIDARGEA